MHRYLTTVLLLAIGGFASFAEAAIPPCPALDDQGRPAPLETPAVHQPVRPSDFNVPVPAPLARRAADIVGHFEHGAGDPWQGVSGQEELSVGYMQWNWRTGTLTRTFLAKVPDEVIGSAPEAIRAGLTDLKKLSAKPNDSAARAQAAAVIADWRQPKAGDPVSRTGLRSSVVGAWKAWLGTPAVVAVQQKLLDAEMRRAYAYSRRWLADADPSGVSPEVDERTLAYFFDLVTFNGGTGGLWMPHVRALRAQYRDKPADLVAAAGEWLQSCTRFTSDRQVRNRKLYNLPDAQANARAWIAAASASDTAFSEAQLDLFALAWLRAQRSTGSDPPKAFPGVYQADVLSRRGTIALDLGQIHGQRWPIPTR